MGKIIETTINRFDGGITNDPRDPRGNVARIVTNFDVLSSPKKMIPRHGSEDGDGSSSTAKKEAFCIAQFDSTPTFNLYALEVASGASTPVIKRKTLTAGTNSLYDNLWTTTNNNSGTRDITTNGGKRFMVAYKIVSGGSDVARIFVFGDNRYLSVYDPTGGTAWDDSATLDFGSITGGQNMVDAVVHTKTDILYMAYWNSVASYIAKYDGATWSGTTNKALTLPFGYIPTTICQYGNNLAIGLAHRSATDNTSKGVVNSRIVLWDLTSVSWNEDIDCGEGEITVLAQVDGELVGISKRRGNTSVFGEKVFFRRLVGNRMEKFMELTNDLSGSMILDLPNSKQIVDGRLYFMMAIGLNGAVRDGLWSIGRSSPNEPFSLVHEYTTNNDTPLTSADPSALRNFIIVGDFVFISYVTGTSSFHVSKTLETIGTFGQTSVYESKRFNAGDSSLKKDLLGVTIMHEYLPSGGTVTVQYRVDQNTSWTTILSNTTANSISSSAGASQTSPAALPKDYKEIEFRITATGAKCEPTSLSFQEEITGKRPY